MIKTYTLKALEKAINRTLSLDETRQTALRALEGKALEIIISPLQVNFFILFANQQLKLLAESPNQVDTVIHSSPLGLIRLSFLPASKARSLFNEQIKISGDIELGQAVKRLFDELNIDWEGHLAQFTGDVVAYQIGSFFRKGAAIQQKATQSFKRNITEYIQEEVCLTPSREEMNDFLNDVDLLSMQVERLQAHIHQLMARYETD